TEVIADLGAAYLLALNGTPWRAILHAVRHGIQSGIFDVGWVEHHPPGSERAAYVEQLHAKMAGGHSFGTACTAIALSAQAGSPPVNMQPTPSKWSRFKSKFKFRPGPGYGADNIREY